LFNYELESRKAYHYPPFYRIINLTFKHKEKHIAEEAANIMIKGLQASFKDSINGPAQPPVDRVRNQYLWEVQLNLPKNAKLSDNCKIQIKQQSVIIQNHPSYKSVSIVADVDPI
jgi:primosomal protein N' (replication factor Y)